MHRRPGFSRRLAALALGAGWPVAFVLGWWIWSTRPTEMGDRLSPPDVPGPAEALEEALDAFVGAPGFASAQIGFVVLDEGGEPWVERGARQAFIPASALKAVTVATAIERLGPGFRFATAVRATGAVGADGTLDGDLVIVGGGDPTLGFAEVESWAVRLVEAGLRRVTGRVVADASYFGGHPASGFWNWGDVGNYYGAGAFGINFAGNRFTARFVPGAEPGSAAAFAGPDRPVPGPAFKNLVRTGPWGSGDGVVIYAGPFGREVLLTGTVPAGVPEFDVEGAVPDPPLEAAFALADALAARGVPVGGLATDQMMEDVPPAPELLIAHESPPLHEVADHLMAVSDNLEAQCLFLALGIEAGAPPSDVIRGYWEARGVAFESLRLEDGSGLARADTVRPVDLARVVHLARRGPQGDAFVATLPEVAEGVRWKGGAMSGVRAYVGLVETRTGRELAFALMVNHAAAGPAGLRHHRGNLIDKIRALDP